MAKIANLRPKIGQIPLLSLDSNTNWHNSIIFHPILTFFIFNCLFYETNRMVSNLKLYLFWLRFWCFSPFLLRGLCTWGNCAHGPKTTLKKSGRVLAFPFNPYLIIKFSKIIGLIIEIWGTLLFARYLNKVYVAARPSYHVTIGYLVYKGHHCVLLRGSESVASLKIFKWIEWYYCVLMRDQMPH